MSIRVKLKFQKPPFAHWVLIVDLEDGYNAVSVRELFKTWRDPNRPPHPRHTVRSVLGLHAIAKHALVTAR